MLIITCLIIGRGISLSHLNDVSRSLQTAVLSTWGLLLTIHWCRDHYVHAAVHIYPIIYSHLHLCTVMFSQVYTLDACTIPRVHSWLCSMSQFLWANNLHLVHLIFTYPGTSQCSSPWSRRLGSSHAWLRCLVLASCRGVKLSSACYVIIVAVKEAVWLTWGDLDWQSAWVNCTVTRELVCCFTGID